MYNGLIVFITAACCCIGGLNSNITHAVTAAEPIHYHKYINVPATDLMPDLSFELTGICGEDSYYYPERLVIKANHDVLQELDFAEEDFAPCTLDDFGWEYGDYRFDGYGGFRILSTSLGKNPSYYYWVWNPVAGQFVENPDLEELIGYTTFDYNKKLIYISGTGGNDYHEFDTYKYIDDKLTLIEKAIDTTGIERFIKLKITN